MEKFSFLERAKVALKQLEASSSIHTDPIGAIAELADNSYDAQAQNFHIDWKEQRIRQEGSDAYHAMVTLEFLDDGSGMSRKEALNIISFGHSQKTASQIGRYGVGLKAGAFHLGREFLLLTKKDGIHTIMMISHAFHEANQLTDSILVPCPSFDQDFRPFFDYSAPPSEVQSRHDMGRHETELALIKEFAPYGKLPVQELFRKIPTDSGTMVIVDKLRRSLTGESTLNPEFANDIRCRDEDLPPHKKSLRKFLEVLYLKPKMKIYLRGEQVRPTKICQSWMAKYRAEISMNTFKDVLKRSAVEREAYIKGLETDRDNLNVEILDIYRDGVDPDEINSRTSRLRTQVQTLNGMIEEAKKENEVYQKAFKTSIITFFIGVQTEDRANNGIHFYANNRLVKWGHKATPFFKNKEKSEKHIGISAYVDLDASTWIPTSSKQGLKAEDMTVLTRKCDEKLKEHFEYFETHWIKKNFGTTIGDNNTVEKFWNLMGYKEAFSAQCSKEEVIDAVIVKLIEKECPRWYVCSSCGVWRRDADERVPRGRKIVRCQDVDGRGCTGSLEGGDDEKFCMDKARWAQIQLQMQKDKERARRLAAAPVTSNRVATSTPSTFMTHPNSILKKPAAVGSPADPPVSSRAVKPVLIRIDSDDEEELMDDVDEEVNPVSSRAVKPVTVQIDSEDEQEFMDDVDEEVNKEDIASDPDPDHQMDDAEDPMEEEEEESPPRRRDPNPQASRPMANVGRRRRPISSDEEDESDEEAPTPSKKSREAKKDLLKASAQKKKFNRGEVLENAISALLAECDMQPLPKKGELNLNLVALFERPEAAADAERLQLERQKESMEENAATVLDYLGTQPYTGINFDRQLPTLDQFHDVARQLKEKKNKKKRQPMSK